MRSDIGSRLREERERLGLNQAELGTSGGVQKLAQLKYEKGDRAPDADYLEAVAAKGVDVLYVLTGKRVGATAPAITSYGRTTVTALPANENAGLTWRQVLIAVVDEMTALKLRMPGATLVELVDLLMLLQKEGRPLQPEVLRGQLQLLMRAQS